MYQRLLSPTLAGTALLALLVVAAPAGAASAPERAGAVRSAHHQAAVAAYRHCHRC